jgi:DNA-binding NarL/FixJ family response regulator
MRIFLADSLDVLRRGLRVLLSEYPGWSVCGEARNGLEALARILELKPDIVIVDLDLPELDGIQATRRIKEALPETEVLFFTIHEERHVIARAIRAGARAYVLKTDSEDALVEAVETLARHLPYFDGRASEMLLSNFLNKTAESDEAQVLTDRESEIVQLLSDGKSNKEVAYSLSISVKTVETHRAAIMRKLGLKSITELVRFAIRNKLIEP